MQRPARHWSELCCYCVADNRPDGSSPGAKAAVYEPQLTLVPYCNTKVRLCLAGEHLLRSPPFAWRCEGVGGRRSQGV